MFTTNFSKNFLKIINFLLLTCIDLALIPIGADRFRFNLPRTRRANVVFFRRNAAQSRSCKLYAYGPKIWALVKDSASTARARRLFSLAVFPPPVRPSVFPRGRARTAFCVRVRLLKTNSRALEMLRFIRELFASRVEESNVRFPRIFFWMVREEFESLVRSRRRADWKDHCLAHLRGCRRLRRMRIKSWVCVPAEFLGRRGWIFREGIEWEENLRAGVRCV